MASIRAQLRLQRREAQALDARGIHVREVEVADLLRVGTRRAIRLLRSRDDELLHLFLRLIVEDDERAVVGAVGGNLRVREPVAAREAVQVVLRTNGAVETREIESRLGRRAGRDGGGGGVGRIPGTWAAQAVSTATNDGDGQTIGHGEPRE